MLSRRSFLTVLAGLSGFAAFPKSAFATPVVVSPDKDTLTEKEPRIPVNPNPSDIVNGPTMRKTSFVSYAQIKRVSGAVNDASSIAKAVCRIARIPGLLATIIKSVSGLINQIAGGVAGGSPSHGIKVVYNETIRYYVNPATGHKEYYETSWGLVSFSLY